MAHLIDIVFPAGVTGEPGRERIRKLFQRMRFSFRSLPGWAWLRG
jgi:hypothetical protein